ncbi:hypothetical protein [Streptomyces sp. NPDC001054]
MAAETNVFAIALFDAVLAAAGDGMHHFVLSTWIGDTPCLGETTLHLNGEDIDALDHTGLSDFYDLFQVALSEHRHSGLVLRTTHDTHEVCMGWLIHLGKFIPLTEAQIFNAYCQDLVEGGPKPPEYGVTYATAPALRPLL